MMRWMCLKWNIQALFLLQLQNRKDTEAKVEQLFATKNMSKKETTNTQRRLFQERLHIQNVAQFFIGFMEG